jgi:psiF repeat
MIRHSLYVVILAATVAVISATNPGYSADNPQQQRMKDCNAQAIGISGDARQKFMSSCLSGKTAETKTPNCVNGKPCGNSCIAKDKVCRK